MSHTPTHKRDEQHRTLSGVAAAAALGAITIVVTVAVALALVQFGDDLLSGISYVLASVLEPS